MKKGMIQVFFFSTAVISGVMASDDMAHAAGSTSPTIASKQKTGAAAEVKKTGAAATGRASDKEAMLALAKKSGCLACHAMDKKLVGPSWVDVASRYKGDPKAKATLIEKVKKGGKGNWTKITGGVLMPPNSPKVSDADIEKLVNFVLSMSQ